MRVCPSGSVLTDSAGTVLISDYPPQECTITNILKLALTNAGLNPTKQDLIDATLALGEVPFANGSNGKGTLTADKPYLADSVHTIRITLATIETPPDANGTYNGCAAPVTCGIVIDDWTPIAGVDAVAVVRQNACSEMRINESGPSQRVAHHIPALPRTAQGPSPLNKRTRAGH